MPGNYGRDHCESLDFVVGAEKRLQDLVGEAEVMPLLQSAVDAGVHTAVILDRDQTPLWRYGGEPGQEVTDLFPSPSGGYRWPVLLEGEPVAEVYFEGGDCEPVALRSMGKVVAGAVNAMVEANLKRMLTTEIHTQVVNQSYEELVETNRKLRDSEQKYRELAEHLEVRVQERTKELKKAYARMIQQHKMASVGQLAAGVAHEINNPMGFLLSNLSTLGKYVGRYQEMLRFYQQATGAQPGCANLKKQAEQQRQKLKLDFIDRDLTDLLEQCLCGGERIKEIVSNLRGFSHIDDTGESPVQINKEIEMTLRVLSGEIPHGARIIRDYSPLPDLSGNPACLGQVFLSIVRNAFQAAPEGLVLKIKTAGEGRWQVIRFSDNGPGVPEELRERIFEPFFTTREIGKGMGLGLATAYEIVSSLGGRIEVDREASGGAAFTVLLPTGGDRT